jgi:TM2 domain-containing membrane protein YozV
VITLPNRFSQPIVFFVIGLAIVGLGATLITDPLQILKMILFAAIGIGVVLFLYKWLIAPKMGRIDSAYQRAAKQSKKRYKEKNQPARQPRAKQSHLKVVKSKDQLLRSKALKRKKEHNFKVIEGKKGKKKNRALF